MSRETQKDTHHARASVGAQEVSDILLRCAFKEASDPRQFGRSMSRCRTMSTESPELLSSMSTTSSCRSLGDVAMQQPKACTRGGGGGGFECRHRGHLFTQHPELWRVHAKIRSAISQSRHDVCPHISMQTLAASHRYLWVVAAASTVFRSFRALAHAVRDMAPTRLCGMQAPFFRAVPIDMQGASSLWSETRANLVLRLARRWSPLGWSCSLERSCSNAALKLSELLRSGMILRAVLFGRGFFFPHAVGRPSSSPEASGAPSMRMHTDVSTYAAGRVKP